MKNTSDFLFFEDWEKPFRKLSGEDFKELFWAMFDFQKEGKAPPDFEGAAAYIADFVFPQLERRAARVEKGRENVRKRWEKANLKDANSNLLHKDKDKDIDQDQDKDQDKDETAAPPAPSEGERAPACAHNRFTPPTKEEVQAYCTERGNRVDAQRFTDFYASKGWRVGKSPMKDWKAAVRRWEQDGTGPGTAAPSFDTDDFFAAALARSYGGSPPVSANLQSSR